MRLSSRHTFFKSLLPLLLMLLGSSIFGRRKFVQVASAAMSTTPPSSSQYKGALIFLHGLGDSPAGWSHLEQMLPAIKPSLKDVKYVFPPAPTIPLTINGGMIMPGWFDLYDWPIGVGSKDDRAGKLKGVEQIQECVKQLTEQDGIPKDKIVVGGFSQGGAIALLAAYYDSNKNGPYAGCAGLSAWLTLTDDLKVSDNSKKIPLFWGHGIYDDKVLFEQQAHGIEILDKQGVESIMPSQYPMGHQSDPEEIKAFAEFVETSIFGGDDKEL